MVPTTALLGALDTKGADLAHTRSLLEAAGARVLMIDTGVFSDPGAPVPEITNRRVMEAAGVVAEEVVARRDRGDAVDTMARGAASLLGDLYGRGRVDGVLGMGGGAGTVVATTAMRALPIGVPKLMVSTVASGNTEPYLGTSDIVMMPAVADIAGLNRISRGVYARAAAMVVAAAGIDRDVEAGPRKPLVAATMFGVTTPCVERAAARLTEAGCEVVVFHATGVGGRTMEQLIRDGLVDAVLDLTTTEWADEVCGGILSAGAARLEAAAARRLPQVVSVGALDMANFGAPATIPEKYAVRRFYRHNALNTLMRTTAAESAEIGKVIARKLDRVTAPTAVLLPLRGVSALDIEGGEFDDPAAREALFAALKDGLDPGKATLREVEAHINDPEFADIAARTLLSLMATANTPN